VPLLLALLHGADARAAGDDGKADTKKDSKKHAKNDEPPREVHVLAPHRDVGETTARREDTRELPGTFGDPTRVAETLPGFVPAASGMQAFYVRGAPPTATGYFVDGVPVPTLTHVGFGPSVIHPALIDRVDFFQGAPPAQYGRYLGGVVAAHTRAPAEQPQAETNVRAFDAGAYGETPLDGGRGSAAVAARYGYPGLIVPLFAPNTGLSYWDYQARATWDLTDRDRIGVFVFGSDDRLTQEQFPQGGAPYPMQVVANQFHRVDLRWDRALGRGATMRVAMTLGRDAVGDDVANATDDMARLRTELEARLSPSLRVRAGADAQFDALRPGPSPPGFEGSVPLVPSRDSVVTGAYVDAAWRISPRVEVIPGLRADVYLRSHVPATSASGVDTAITPAIDPRLAVRVKVLDGLTSVSSFGVSHQLPGLVAQFPETAPFLQPGIQEDIQASVQMSQGVEIALPASFSASATGFLHDYFGLPDVTAVQCAPTAYPGECVTPGVDGRAYGLELLVRRSFTERFSMQLAYTLSRSTRQASPYFSDAPTMTIVSEYDRTHVLSAAASYDFGKGWRAGGRVVAYTGLPYTPVSMGLPVLPYDSARLPGFYRIDVRLEKAWRVGKRDRIAVVLEGVNVTLNKEAVNANCGGTGTTGSAATALVGDGGPAAAAAAARGGGFRPMATAGMAPSCTIDTVGPITIPSIGVEGTFR